MQFDPKIPFRWLQFPAVITSLKATVGVVLAMRRRDFIKGVAGSATAWPLIAYSQPTANAPVITVINARKADAATVLAAEFRKGLSQSGFAEGKDVLVEYHWLDGHYEDLAEILDDAVKRPVAVIATPANTPGSLAAKAATSTIPIVFGVSEDPVALGLVASLPRPGGNVTGINFFASEIEESAEFQFGISPRTRRDYVKQIKRIEKAFGDFPIKAEA